MSLIKDSEECSKSPVEFFSTPPTQTVIESSNTVDTRPTTAPRDGTAIDFYIPEATDQYIDGQNCKLYTKVKITRENGGDLLAADVTAPINDLANGLYSNVELFLNDQLVSQSNNMHGYVSMISHLIHDSDESLQSERSMRLLYKDTPGQMDAINAKIANRTNLIRGYDIVVGDNGAVAEVAETIGNNGLHQRYLLTRESRHVELLTSLRIDLFEQVRYLPSGVSMKLRFHPQKNAFMLMGPEDSTFKVKILEAYLLVRRVTPSPGVLVGHEDTMKMMPAKYPVTRKLCKSFAVAQGLRGTVLDNVFLSQVPKRVVIGMVDGDAFAGCYNKNPYNFKHYNVDYMQLFVDGNPVNLRPLKPNIAERDYIHCYETLYRGLNRMDGERGSIIKRADWDKGYSLFAFDLTPDMDPDDHYSLIKHGNVRLEIQFSEALAQTIDIIVYAEFDSILEITSDRNIITDYV